MYRDVGVKRMPHGFCYLSARRRLRRTYIDSLCDCFYPSSLKTKRRESSRQPSLITSLSDPWRTDERVKDVVGMIESKMPQNEGTAFGALLQIRFAIS